MFCIIDTETNGGKYRHEKLMDIAIFRYDGHKIVDQFMSLVNPEAEISPFVQRLTSITPKMVKTAPKFHEIAKRIIEITEGCTLVGHNIEFDYRILRQSFKELGYHFKINTLDTIPLAKELIPEAESYSLGKLSKALGIAITDRHRAAGDARATLELFKILDNKDLDNKIIQKQYNETNAKNYPNKVKELTRDLPNEKGIVYFQNEEGKILYSSYTDDLQKFSKKLLNSDSEKWKPIQQHSEKIYFDLTGSDLLSTLIMISKGIHKKRRLPFGLYYRKEKFWVEKTTINPSEKPFVKFHTYTQGLKALRMLNTKEEFKNIETFKNTISLKKRNEIGVFQGRTLGEQAFLVLQNGKIDSYGFFELHSQISSKAKLEKLKIPLKNPSTIIENELQLALLKGEIKIYTLPK